jgi:hypothetical protein
MEIFYVSCPQCKKSFHCDANLLGLDIPLHCPSCDLYFDPEEKKGKQPPNKGTAFVGLSRIDRKILYIPVQEKKSPTRV